MIEELATNQEVEGAIAAHRSGEREARFYCGPPKPCWGWP
jgi:hypothetical protein